jgi:hypothetical protein
MAAFDSLRSKGGGLIVNFRQAMRATRIDRPEGWQPPE